MINEIKVVPVVEISTPTSEHESNPESFIEQIVETVQTSINKEFPLSGGETEIDI